jgi:hypothetical protein
MPRLSLYRPEKGNDYKFLDRTISEMYQIGGVELYIHKYLGPKNPSDADATADQPQYDAVKETNIQDLLFLENRDRTYDPSIYRTRGVYNVQDLDFNLSQFGLFIDNDTLYMTVHINDIIRTIGRKPMSGDVIEVPNVKDEFALNEWDVGLPKYFVVTDVGRAAEGFSATWYPHLYRLKLTKISDSQQYKDIFAQKIVDPVTGEETDRTLSDILSTAQKSLFINDQLLLQAKDDADQSGYETQQFYTLAVDDKGNAALQTVDQTTVDSSYNLSTINAASQDGIPKRTGYAGYLVGDGVPENGAAFGHGITFPNGAIEGDYFLRTDFLPNRLFRFDGMRWVKREDNVRMTMTNEDPTKPYSETNISRQTQKGTFINNNNQTGVDLLLSDMATSTSDEIVTTIDYINGMFAEVALADSPYIQAAVSSNLAGKAVINLTNDYVVGSKVELKLYRTSVSERVSLSKALKKKPGADL